MEAELEDTSEDWSDDDGWGWHSQEDNDVDVELVTVDDFEVIDPFSPPPLTASPTPPPPPCWLADPPIVGDAGIAASIGFRCSCV